MVTPAVFWELSLVSNMDLKFKIQMKDLKLGVARTIADGEVPYTVGL